MPTDVIAVWVLGLTLAFLVWCVCEVLELLLSGVTPDDARKIGEARLNFDADLVGVRKEQP